ncbi:MurT ligase domain-containing protein [Heyndrickxia acidicola]|uniref:Lipid II isoglutaminyl synthase (glutamine-hydrolyzing) subunit MurT n=1 Tax=Heyndrickxia acidicola TaxID=209389 RepID=A0ABU6ML74_9BACI|nr:MurT ligase domain-containing protein [Heyndrickxia acidicola]MED1205435.1 MurT ligase domain-containing protein [Heyndrickxia acidicola]
MKSQLAIWAGKTAGKLSRMLGYGGSTIPGVVARNMDSQFLQHLRRISKTIIYITGTNGKTTLTNLISCLLETAGSKVIANREGSNLVTGITATLVQSTPMVGWNEYDTAVIEVDEASLPKVVAECQPDYLIITNFFRDQLDRYGELDVLIEKMKNSLKTIEAKLILNADDPFVHRFSDLPTEMIYAGLDEKAGRFPTYRMNESKYCPICQQEFTYKAVHFGHLGHYECTCGFTRPITNISVQNIYQEEKGIRLTVNGENYSTNLKGMYNAYNAVLAISICKELGLNTNQIRQGLLSFQKTDGRMQDFLIGEEVWKLNLVKNPAGANVTLSEFLQTDEKKQLIFCLNDCLADGEDVSWIWDIDMEAANREEIESFIASGKRAHDAALRLKYAGIPEEKITILDDLKEAFLFAKQKGYPSYIMATYTCLSPMISILSRETKK